MNNTFEKGLQGPDGFKGPPGLEGPQGASLTKEQFEEIMVLVMAAKPKERTSFFKIIAYKIQLLRLKFFKL